MTLDRYVFGFAAATDLPDSDEIGTIGSLASYLQAQLFPYRPAHITVVRLASGQPVLRVEYGAPSPLGLLGKG